MRYPAPQKLAPVQNTQNVKVVVFTGESVNEGMHGHVNCVYRFYINIIYSSIVLAMMAETPVFAAIAPTPLPKLAFSKQ